MQEEQCAECERLWRAYAQVTTRHITLVNEQRAAYRDRDFHRAAQLDVEIRTVGEERQTAGDRIYRHEAERHQRFIGHDASTPARSVGEG